MPFFGQSLSEIEKRLMENQKRTRAAFPEEIKLIEFGLALMHDITQITRDASKEYPSKPNMYVNHNLFARNRQLLLNAYVSLLFSSYGTEYVILRTALENYQLMRLFNKNPQMAFEWLPEELQKRFTEETKFAYGKNGIQNKTYDPSEVTKLVLEGKDKRKVKKDILRFYGQLCNYTHPNFRGWHELVMQVEGKEIILNKPSFSAKDSEIPTGSILFLIQISFKAFAETFRGYLSGFAPQLIEWQSRFEKTIIKYNELE